jgi:hypothetical protein
LINSFNIINEPINIIVVIIVKQNFTIEWSYFHGLHQAKNQTTKMAIQTANDNPIVISGQVATSNKPLVKYRKIQFEQSIILKTTSIALRLKISIASSIV